jgi:hypothetical protein
MKVLARVLTGTALATGLFSLVLQATSAFAGDDIKVQHVLLVSIDGFHAVDLAICVANGTCPNLEKLTDHGFTYTNASTTKPSDSFPGMLAQFTGGTSKSTGVFYDDSYDRTLFAPLCASGPGAEVMLAENTDKNLHSIAGGVPASLTGLNAAIVIDPNNLPGQKVSGSCTPLWPHNFIRTNTVFGVLHKHGRRTAWSDKHPAYDIINGNKPTTQPVNGPGTNVDDFFAPEINSDLTPANVALINTQLGPNFSTAPVPTSFPAGADFTGTIPGVEWYDGIKVQAILNEIKGFDHTGTRPLGTPALFGMNFQAVSVGQKLAGDGYADPAATPSAGLANAIAFVDKSIGQMISALDSRGLRGKTLIIVSAKHGQSPIDLSKLVTFDDSVVIKAPIIANYGFDIGDDGVLIWLKDNTGTKTADAVGKLNGFVGDTGIAEWLSGPLLPLSYQDPAHDSRTPDIIGIAKIGVIYTKGTKIAEHGGFNEDDTHVALLVSHPFLRERSINTAVATTQIAPTILNVLGLNPQELEAARLEGTQILPGLFVDKE